VRATAERFGVPERVVQGIAAKGVLHQSARVAARSDAPARGLVAAANALTWRPHATPPPFASLIEIERRFAIEGKPATVASFDSKDETISSFAAAPRNRRA